MLIFLLFLSFSLFFSLFFFGGGGGICRLSSGAEVEKYRDDLIQADTNEQLLMQLVTEMRERKYSSSWDAIDYCANLSRSRGFTP